MSGECYSAVDKKDKSKMEQQSPKGGETVEQLLEYETVISSAENKCSQLKTQIDRIKQMYNNHQNATSGSSSPVRTTVLYSGNNNPITLVMPKNYRQNSEAIGTDTTGAALGTINNILAGITKPLGSSFFTQENEKVSSPKVQTERLQGSEQLRGVEDVKINSRSRQSCCLKSRTKCNTKRSRSKLGAVFPISSCKKLKKLTVKATEKRIHKESDTISGMPVMNKHSRKILQKQRFTLQNKLNFLPAKEKNGDLVELYHNTAVKESKSSDSDLTKKKSAKNERIARPKTNIDIIPPLTIHDTNTDTMINENRIRISPSKNYTMPTISSRMKRVAKYYMNSFNIKTIPFCLSTSTSPSHNIGFNIQQVMSMVKNKQQFARLSPTLAYNIGLAAEKNDVNSMPLLLSCMTLKNYYSQCPLDKPVNYQQLQEVAKTIPQDIIEEDEDQNDAEKSPETQSIIITGPSGDVRVKNRKQTVWTANSNEKSCTCVPPKGMGFQQIVNKFNGVKPVVNATSINKSKLKLAKTACPCGEDHGKYSENTPLQNKERKLKEVLGKMHDEFEQMTKTYDELVKRTEEGTPSVETIRKLENLDKELNSKEEEIVMVMTLYKEVMTLKQQVKTLKTRTSKESISVKSQKVKANGCNNVITAGVLNKLLQQVQHYQVHYRKH